MKKLLLLSFITFCFIQMNAQIRIVQVTPSSNEISIKNFGGGTINIAGYRWCALFSYGPPFTLAGMNIISGSLSLTAGSTVVMDGYTLNNAFSDLCLYLPTGSFGSAAAMVDFMQWGSGGNGREGLAFAKGIWSLGDFVAGSAPFDYTGNGSQNGVTFWQATGAPVADFNADMTSVCGSDSVTFTEATLGTVTTWSWNFGAGAFPSSANTQGPHKVSYSTNGLKTVSLAITGPGGNDSTAKFNYINVDTTLMVNITGLGDVCSGDSIPLDAGAGFDTYLWNTGVTTRILAVLTGGTYWVNVTSGACVGSDTTSVNEDTVQVSVNITPANPMICAGDSIQLDAGVHTSYYWSNCDSTQTIFADIGGDWWVQVWDGGVCTDMDTVNVTEDPIPTINIGPDTALFLNDTITLDATVPNSTYLWSTGDTTPTLLYIFGGIADSVHVSVTRNTGCTGEDYILIGVASGLNHLDAARTLEISPNPARNTLRVSGDKGLLLIFDVLGQLQVEVEHELHSVVDVSLYESGLYILQLRTSRGSLTRKLIIE